MPLRKIDQLFNPYQVKDKWKRFFEWKKGPIEIDQERALKNEYSQALVNYIIDQKQRFQTDKHMIRAVNILFMAHFSQKEA